MSQDWIAVGIPQIEVEKAARIHPNHARKLNFETRLYWRCESGDAYLHIGMRRLNARTRILGWYSLLGFHGGTLLSRISYAGWISDGVVTTWTKVHDMIADVPAMACPLTRTKKDIFLQRHHVSVGD